MAWYRDVWPWLLLLGIVVLGGLGGYAAWQEWGGDDEGEKTVPRAVGLDQSEAIARVQDAGFRVALAREASSEPEGRVTAQEPGAGAQLDEGQTVTLSTSEGEAAVTDVTVVTQTETVETEPRRVEVPNVLGQNHVPAGAAIEGAGLAADSYPVESQEARGVVISQNPEAGIALPEGDPVRLNVSVGPERRRTRVVPDVRGSSASNARERLRKAGFTVRTLTRDAPEVGDVVAQEPGPGVRAADLSQVTVVIAR